MTSPTHRVAEGEKTDRQVPVGVPAAPSQQPIGAVAVSGLLGWPASADRRSSAVVPRASLAALRRQAAVGTHGADGARSGHGADGARSGTAEPPVNSSSGLSSVIRREYDPQVTDTNRADAEQYIAARALDVTTKFCSLLQRIRTDDELSVNAAIGIALRALTMEEPLVTLKVLLAGSVAAVPDLRKNAIAAQAVRVLNYMEQELATRAVVTGSTGTMQIGTEFTFGDGLKPTVDAASINLDLADPKERKTEKQKAAHSTAQTTIYQWGEAAKKLKAKIPGGPAITVETVKGKAEYARQITYEFPEIAAAGDKPRIPPWTWFWVADIDMACYETQTVPTTIDTIKVPAVQAIITEHIFGGAKGLGLIPDPKATGGGGHISLDASTGFGHTDNGRTTTSYEVLLATLLDLQTSCNLLQRQFFAAESKGAATGEADPTNAPWLKDQQLKDAPKEDVLAAYKKKIDQLDQSVKKGEVGRISTVTDELVKFNQKLTNPMLTGSRKVEIEDPESISHYQAVNIEHLGDTAVSARRVEIRDIPAQTSAKKLTLDLDAIAASLQQVRDSVRIEQEFRLLSAKKIGDKG